MKQQKVESYKPNYAKIVKTVAMTVSTAAILAGTTGCIVENDPVGISGAVIVEPTAEPEATEVPALDGYISIDPDIDETDPETGNDDLVLSGDVMIVDEHLGQQDSDGE